MIKTLNKKPFNFKSFKFRYLLDPADQQAFNTAYTNFREKRRKVVKILKTQKYPFKKNNKFFNLGKRKLEEILARFKEGVNGLLTVHSTKHNTIITLTTPKGDTLGWASAGMFYKKGKRGTPLAASLAAKKIAKFAKRKNIKVVGIKFNGLGKGNVAIVNEIKKNKINILYLKDVTPTSHNGCRPPKISRKKNSHRQALYE